MDLQGKSEGNSKFTQIGKIVAENLNISVESAETLLNAIDKPKQGDGIGILRTGDPAKTTKHWQGREEDLEKLTNWLNDSDVNLLGIEAIGGMGKSTLAAKLYESDDLKFQKVYWADVTNGATFAEVARKILAKFGLPIPEQEQALSQALVQGLRQGKFLLIIDNLESLLTTDHQWTGPFWRDFFLSWREYGSNSKILITSRERPQEPLFDHWLNLKGLAKEAGARLLAAKGIQGDREVFCELVDGHPLLLTIVADLLRDEFRDGDVPPSLEYLERLGLGNLWELMTKAEGQHRKETVGLVVVLDVTFQRLSAVQQKIFLAVSVLRQRFNAEMAKAVAGVELDAKALEKELRQIVNKSLLGVRRDKETLERWYEFQPVVWEYANCQAGYNQRIHQNAVHFYLSQTKLDRSHWQSLADIKEYIEITYHWLRLTQIEQAFKTVRIYEPFLRLRGFNSILVDIYRRIINTYKKLDQKPERNHEYGCVLNDLGNAHYNLGLYQLAFSCYKKYLELSINNKSNEGQGDAYGGLGNIYSALGKYSRAIHFYKLQLKVSRKIGKIKSESVALGNLGNTYRTIGNYNLAFNYHQKSLEVAKAIDSQEGIAAGLCNLGNTAFHMGEYEKAIKFLKESLNVAQSIHDQKCTASCFVILGFVYRSLGIYEKSILYSQKSFHLSLQIGSKELQISALNCLSFVHRIWGRHEQSIKHHQKSLKLARDIGNYQLESVCLLGLGNTQYVLREYDVAAVSYQKSLKITEKVGDQKGRASALDGLGKIYQSTGECQVAISFHKKALEITRTIGDRQGESCFLISLGNAYISLGEYQKSINLFQESLEITKEINNRHEQSASLSALGNVYYHLGKYKESIIFHQQSLITAKNIGYPQGEAASLGNLGNAYYSLGEYQRAIAFHQQSLDIAREIGDRQGEANSLGNLGNAYHSLGEYQRAISLYQKCIEIKAAIGDKRGEADFLMNLGQIYQKVGRVKEGFVATQKAQQIYGELDLPLNALPYPQWMKSIARFAQKGIPQFILLFIAGIVVSVRSETIS